MQFFPSDFLHSNQSLVLNGAGAFDIFFKVMLHWVENIKVFEDYFLRFEEPVSDIH